MTVGTGVGVGVLLGLAEEVSDGSGAAVGSGPVVFMGASETSGSPVLSGRLVISEGAVSPGWFVSLLDSNPLQPTIPSKIDNERITVKAFFML